MGRKSLPYSRKRNFLISFKVDEPMNSRIENILERSSLHEDVSQLMRYVLNQYLPVIEEQLRKEEKETSGDGR